MSELPTTSSSSSSSASSSARALVSAALLLAALSVPIVGGCSGSLDPRAQVTDMRVLGVRLEPPAAAPGDTIQASALVVDPTGADITLSWYYCPAPVSMETYFGAEFGTTEELCNDLAYPDGVFLGEGADASFDVPDDFLDQVHAMFEGGEALGIDSQALDGLLLVAGWHLQVLLVAETSEKRTVARKRLIVSPLGGLNANPDPPSVWMRDKDESETAEVPTTTAELPPPGACLVPGTPESVGEVNLELIPINLPEEPETYVVVTFTGEVEDREETLFFSWFSTVPSLGDPLTKSGNPDVDFDLSRVRSDHVVETADGPAVPLWMVLRDGRGGTSWCSSLLPYTGELLDP